MTALATPAPWVGTPNDAYAGLGTAVRVVVRRNRVRLGVWAVSLIGMFAFVCSYYRTTLNTQQALDAFAVVSSTPSIRALTGLAAAPNTLGGAVWTKIWMFITVALAFAVVFLVTRSGRADEELGRTELLRARMLGIHASSTATWLVNAVLCLVVGAGVAASSIAFGLDPEGAGVGGSLVLGVSVAGVGLVAVGIAAVADQIAATARGANMIGSVVLGVCYVLRMVGDVGNGRLTWASPIGWGQQMQPWGANRWWVAAPLVGLAAVLVVLALRLEQGRDLGAGLLPERRGPAGAPARYTSPLGLALRLQRGPIIGWSAAIVLAALLYGSVIRSMTDLVDNASPTLKEILGSGVASLVALLVQILALLVGAFAVQATVALRMDEAAGMAELQLAGALSRARWVLHRLAIPAVGSAVLLVVSGALLGATWDASVGGHGHTGSIALAALAYWPAAMVLVGVATALFGWLPRGAVPGSWGALAAMFVVTMLGVPLRLPTWLVHAMPFEATPAQPADAFTWRPVLVLAAVAAVLVWLGVDRFRRRDLAPA